MGDTMIEIGVTPNPLTAGGTATVSITGGPPNTTVVVVVDNGGDGQQNVLIQTDAQGSGSQQWEVPAEHWEVAKFNSEGATEVSRLIVEPDQ